MPSEDDFELAEARIVEPEDGCVLVRNVYMSVDPYMRGRMLDRKSYVPPFAIGEALTGSCIGQVVDSRYPRFRAGDYVHGSQGWREYFVSDGRDLRRIDPEIVPLSAYLSVLGLTGLTAYIGVLDIGEPRKGETMLVSAAAGAVGQVACQIARIKGCRVVGSAGSREKIAWLTKEAGIDAAINYHETGDFAGEIARCCPDGIDIDFENVGGEQFEAVLRRMNPFGRVIMCGMISQYNVTEATPAPRNLANVISKRLTVKGLIVTDHLDRLPEFYSNMGRWIADGHIKWTETIVDGIEKAPRAFLDLFAGANVGKMIVRLGPERVA